MQNNETFPQQVIDNLLHRTRSYFGLAPSIASTPSGAQRMPTALRSLLAIGSLGTALASPAFALNTEVKPANDEIQAARTHVQANSRY